jgi:hypothetical protein
MDVAMRDDELYLVLEALSSSFDDVRTAAKADRPGALAEYGITTAASCIRSAHRAGTTISSARSLSDRRRSGREDAHASAPI